MFIDWYLLRDFLEEKPESECGASDLVEYRSDGVELALIGSG